MDKHIPSKKKSHVILIHGCKTGFAGVIVEY